ncbi:polarity establishment/cellular polarization [Rhodotorula kratochvilovae]
MYSLRAVLAILCAAAIPLALAAPTLVYPLQAQRPPVARSNEVWSFALLPGTFSSPSGGAITLAAPSSLPSWASFDAASGTFSGTPTSADLGSTAVTVRATDSSDGATATGRFTLLVVDAASDPAPYVRLPLAAQLESAAAVSGGGSLTPGGALKVPPQWSFSFGFQQYTVENAQRQKMYYSSFLRGSTSLPPWIKFDNSTVTFDGLAPFEPGEYEIELVASERFGYGDARQSFTIAIAQHSFELVSTNGTGVGVFPSINATVGGPVNYSLPLGQLRVDNSTLKASDLASASADLAQASFLAFDAAALSVTGDVPVNFSATSGEGLPIPLTLVDQYNDTLRTNLSLVVVPSLFNASAFPAMIDVQVGKKFEQDLSAFLAPSTSSKRALPATLDDITFSASITPSEAASWLSFDSSSFTLSGTAPASIPPYQTASVTLDALDPATSAVSRASFVLSVIEGGGNSTFPTSSPSADNRGLSSSAKLGLGLGLGLGLPLLLALILAACCIRRRRRAGAGEQGGKSVGGLLISHPRPLSASPAPNGAFSASATTIVGSAHDKGEKASPPVATGGWDTRSASSEKRYAPPVGGAETMALPIAVMHHHHHAPHKLDTLHEADEPPPTPGATTPKGPKRFDVMGLLFRSESGGSILDAVRGKGKARERSHRSLSSLNGGAAGAPLPRESSLFGLGLDEVDADEPRRIVVVSDGGRGIDGNGTYASPVAGPAAGPSGRVSSWESGASSSLFYSDRSAGTGSPRSLPHRRTASRTGSGSGSGLGSGFGSPVPSQSSGSSGAVSVGGTRRGPPSIPQRRRDFLPLPLKSPTTSPSGSPAPSPTRDTYDVVAPPVLVRDDSGGASSESGGIRMVGSHSGSSGVSTQEGQLGDASADAQHFQQYSSPSRSGSYPSDSPSQESLPAPRLIAFTQERRPPPFSQTFTSQASLAARRPSEPTDAEEHEYADEAVEDAWEDEDEGDEGDERPRSGVYAPPDWEGSPTTSAVIYPSETHGANRETWQSRSAYGESVLSRTSFDDVDPLRLSAGGVRYVGSVASTNVSPAIASSFAHDTASRYSQSSEVPPTPRSDVFSAASSQPTAATSTPSHHKRSSSYLEPLRVQLHVGEPFRFVPRLDPPPFASITASPGRGGPPRATYHAWIETALLDSALAQRFFGSDELEDGIAPLPEWVHFDPAAIEVFGLARRVDAGVWPLVVVERKVQRSAGSPTRVGGRADDGDVTEQVVGRFELVVAHREEENVGDEEDEGELRIVTY